MASPERAPLQAYLRRQVVLDAALKRSLRQAIRQLDPEIKRLARGSAGSQLRAAQLSLNRDVMNMWLSMGKTIEQTILDSDKDIAKVQKLFDDTLLGRSGAKMTEAQARSMLATARSGLEQYVSRQHFNMSLSDRVYRNGRRGVKTVENLINTGLLQGKSAAEIATSVRKYISPNTPGGASYAAMRLGRTELNNAFHQTSIRMAKEDPFVESLKWNLSRSHGAADKCDQYAKETHTRGGEAGVYPVGDVPAKPHPQCLCFTTPVVIAEEEFLRRLRKGDFDSMADLVA